MVSYKPVGVSVHGLPHIWLGYHCQNDIIVIDKNFAISLLRQNPTHPHPISPPPNE